MYSLRLVMHILGDTKKRNTWGRQYPVVTHGKQGALIALTHAETSERNLFLGKPVGLFE